MSVMTTSTSITHTMGNVTMSILDYIKNYIESGIGGRDFFKTVHVATRLAYKQLNIFRTKKEFWKLSKPMLIIRPRIDFDDTSTSAYGSTMVGRVHNSYISPMEFTDLQPIIEDINHGILLQVGLTRLKMIFDVVIVLDSYNKQVEMKHFLRTNSPENTPFPIKTPLEAYFPKNMMKMIANHLNIKMDNAYELLEYLNTYSNCPFTYKLKDGSGNSEFFSLYMTNIECVISDISIDDGDQKGLVQDTYTVAFQMSAEFYSMSQYNLTLIDNNDIFTRLPLDLSDNSDRMDTLFSIPLMYDLQLENGWNIYNSPTYNIPPNVEDDITDLSSILSEQFKAILDYKKRTNLPLEMFFKFRVFKDYIEIPYGLDGFMIDFNTLELHTYDCDYKKTYRLFILMNSAYINSITAENFEFNKEK